MAITRNIPGGFQYVLESYRLSTGWSSDACYTQETDFGRGICKQLATQGWEYVDDEY